jgi:DNA-binding GntR family transcriptional regulator
MAIVPTLQWPRRPAASPAPLDGAELRELLPAALILEDLAVRRAPTFDGPAIERLRAACARMRAAAGRPAVAAVAEDEFHRELVRGCEDARLRAMALGVQGRLMPYREAAPVGAVHHDAVVDALESGDNVGAARRIRAAFVATLARLLAGIEPRSAVVA